MVTICESCKARPRLPQYHRCSRPLRCLEGRKENKYSGLPKSLNSSQEAVKSSWVLLPNPDFSTKKAFSLYVNPACASRGSLGTSTIVVGVLIILSFLLVSGTVACRKLSGSEERHWFAVLMAAWVLLDVKSKRSRVCLGLSIHLYFRHTKLRHAIRGGRKKVCVTNVPRGGSTYENGYFW